MDEATAKTSPVQKGDRKERTDGLLTTGDMARLSNNTLRTVRFYEEAGILRPDRRSAGGHRLFSPRELERLQFVTDMRAVGLSLDRIRQLLELKGHAPDGPRAATEICGALAEQIAALDDKIRAFSRLHQELVRARELLQDCRRCAGDNGFPERCDDCDVLQAQQPLPPAMRVLWALGSGEDKGAG